MKPSWLCVTFYTAKTHLPILKPGVQGQDGLVPVAFEGDGLFTDTPIVCLLGSFEPSQTAAEGWILTLGHSCPTPHVVVQLPAVSSVFTSSYKDVNAGPRTHLTPV